MTSPFHSDVRIGSQSDLREFVENRFDEVLRLRQTLGSEHPWTLLAVARLAAALRLSGRLFEAIDQHSLALDGLQALSIQWIPASVAYSDAGVTMAALGRLEDAVGVQRTALDELIDAAGALDPATLGASENLALSLRALGQYDEALDLQGEMVETLTSAFGGSHPETLAASGQRAATLGAAGRLEEAQADWQTVFDYRREALGLRDPRTLAALANVGETMREAGNTARALELHEQVVDELIPLVGEYHPSALSAKEDLAITLMAQDDPARARELGQEVVEGRTWVLGPEHPQTLAAMRTLGTALRATGELERACTLAERTVRGSARALGRDHPDTLAAREDLSVALEAAGEPGDAKAVRSETLALHREAQHAAPAEENLASQMTAQDEFAAGSLALPPADLAFAPQRVIVTRTPHLEIETEGPLLPGTHFRVYVYVDREAPSEEEDSTPIRLELPPEVTVVLLDLWLVASRHFKIFGDALEPLRLDIRRDEIPRVMFNLAVAEKAERFEDEPFVMAVFSHNGRPSGRIRRVVQLATPVEATL